jgi:parvulin-like peptidyl-prolyl isomerase
MVLGISGCGDPVLATVGSKKITRSQLLAKLEKDSGQEALVGMINRQLVEDAFAATGATITPQQVDERLNQIKKSYPTPEQFAQAMTAQGLTEADVRDTIALNLKLEYLCTKDVKVDEASLRKFYEENREKFDKPEMVSYSEIVVTSLEEANKIKEALAKPGAKFEDLARQNSISPNTREQGGKVPPMPKQYIGPPEVAKALEGLKPGQIAGPIAAEGRYYIVRLDAITPAEKSDFNKDRAKIEERYKLEKAKRPDEVLSELRQKAVINIIDPKYKFLQEQFKPKPALPSFGEKGGAPAQQQPPAGKSGAPAQQQAPAGKGGAPAQQPPAQKK